MLDLPRMARRAPGVTKFLRLVIVIIHRLYAVHGRNTSARDASSRGRIVHGYAQRKRAGTVHGGTDRLAIDYT
jgi:hypothetical protein